MSRERVRNDENEKLFHILSPSRGSSFIHILLKTAAIVQMFINYSNPLNFQVKCDEHFPSLTIKTLFDGKRNLFSGLLFRQIELFATITYIIFVTLTVLTE